MEINEMHRRRNTKPDIAAARRFIEENCSSLYCGLFAFHFGGGSAEAVFEALRGYQNPDGGFGHGLEADFLLPDSSPMATATASTILEEVGAKRAEYPGAGAAVEYLEQSFDPERCGWYAVSAEVNGAPHAPWWHWNEAEGMTVIDRHPGNPSAELLAGLWRFRDRLQSWTAESLIRLIHEAVGRLEGMTEYPSPHEIYCYIGLYHAIRDGISDAAARMVVPPSTRSSLLTPGSGPAMSPVL